ncbi:MAG: SurA N-terminal domain-containing protein [Candidatus Campbellbacteria bacterium]|nr:SurA N-terminal domain-containing protein [Candidatus Campbellbacteria bacterium]
MEEEQTQQEEHRNPPREKKGRKSEGGGVGKIIGLLVVLAIIAGVGMYLMQSGSSAAVATVDGETITRAQYESRVDQVRSNYESQSGGPIEDKAIEDQIKRTAIDGLINETLLVNAAEKAGVNVSDEEVEQSLEEYKAQYESDDAFQNDLKSLGISENDLRENIRNSIMVTSYVESQAEEGEIAVTDAEIEEFYNLQVSNIPEGTEDGQVPTLEEFREQGRQILENQKLNSAASRIVEGLRSEANIEILIDIPEAPQQPGPGSIEPPTEAPPVEEGPEEDPEGGENEEESDTPVEDPNSEGEPTVEGDDENTEENPEETQETEESENTEETEETEE